MLWCCLTKKHWLFTFCSEVIRWRMASICVGEIIVANVHSLAVAHVEKRIHQQRKMCCTSAVTIIERFRVFEGICPTTFLLFGLNMCFIDTHFEKLKTKYHSVLIVQVHLVRNVFYSDASCIHQSSFRYPVLGWQTLHKFPSVPFWIFGFANIYEAIVHPKTPSHQKPMAGNG